MTYPKSFLKLLLIGFSLVLIPLLLAFVYANISFGNLTKQSLLNNKQALETTRTHRILQEELVVMERSARQYYVLRDQALLTNYTNAHQRLQKAAYLLQQQTFSHTQLPELAKFSKLAHSLNNIILQTNAKATFDQSMGHIFAQLSNNVQKMTRTNNALIDFQANFLEKKVAQTQALLFWQALILTPFALLIAGLITWMIARPIRRMDMAINQLGRGDYEHAIDINGPDDLKKLGARLDWLRSELKGLHTQKQRFLQQASHELKTPLTAIREASELLNDGTAGKLNTQQTEITRILKESSLRLQKMIENLLKYNENTFNATQANAHFQTLKPIINSITEAYALSIKQKNISINQLVGDVGLVVNAEKLSLILDNLISNAIKFTPNNGFITLRATKTSDCVNIHIEDSGIGISKANQPHLFDAFYRGDEPENSLIKGSGLGLFIAKEAALSIHADIQLLPSSAGAHFMVSVPVHSKNIA